MVFAKYDFDVWRLFIIFETQKSNIQMNIKYEIHSIKNSKGTGEEQKFVRIFGCPPQTDRQMESLIQNNCSLTKGDVQATLMALRDCMVNELSQGNRFHIPEIGYFSLAVELDMPDDKPMEKVRGDYISVRNIKFRPDAELLGEVKRNARFERSKFSSKSRQYTEDELLDKIKEYLATNNCITRRDLELNFGLRQSTALKCLKHFTEIGILKKEGARNSPVYFLNKQ